MTAQQLSKGFCGAHPGVCRKLVPSAIYCRTDAL